MLIEQVIFRIKKHHESVDTSKIWKAYHFAENAHKNQTRASGEDYIIHPVAVAHELAKMGGDEETIIAGLLHDVLEDTSVQEEVLLNQFGQTVTQLVKGVTKVQYGYDHHNSLFEKNIRRFFQTICRDHRVLFIKIVDRLHNMRTLQFLKNKDKQYKKAFETQNIYAPLADYLGLNHIRNELFDLSLRYLQPDNFSEIKEQLSKYYSQNDADIDYAMRSLEQTLSGSGVNYSITGRLKTVSSIWFKMKRKKIHFNQLSDIIGFRILVSSIEDCYVVQKILSATYGIISGSFKDYIKIPKENYYQSLHSQYNIQPFGKIEIQIRTHQMHELAENGLANHAKYKRQYQKNLVPFLERIVQKVIPNKKGFLPVTFQDHKKDEIFCFTPKGDVILLPQYSTCLDFAYKIHSQLSAQAYEATVNGKVVSLITQLNSGDEVFIKASEKNIVNQRHMEPYIAQRQLVGFLKRKSREQYSVNKDKFILRLNEKGIKYKESIMQYIFCMLNVRDKHYFWQSLESSRQEEIVQLYMDFLNSKKTNVRRVKIQNFSRF